MIENTGVMPLPAASIVYLRELAGSSSWVKWPAGGSTSSRSPARSSLIGPRREHTARHVFDRHTQLA